jgi:hypothetical protein
MRKTLSIGCLILSLLILPTAALAEDSSALINQALDKDVKLDVDGVLPTVIKAIEDQTGVPIKTDSDVYDLLPWGDQTNVSARIENQTLREALTAICHKLGLTYEVGTQTIYLEAMPALSRLGRRATVQELGALDMLSSTTIELPKPRTNIHRLVDALDQKLVDMKSPYAIEYRPGEGHDKEPALKEDAPVTVPRGSTMAEALESLVQDTDATWYPWGKDIVIISKEAMVQLQLSRTVTAQYNGVDVQQVLDDLAQRAGVEFEMEPGAIQRVPTEFRSIKLVLDNVPVRQVLDSISGVTGLNYAVTADGVYVWNQNPHPAAAAGNNGDRVIGMIRLGNGMELLIRNNDLPERLRRYAEQQKTEAIHLLQEQLKAEQATQPTTPTTLPATMPAADPE